MGQETGDREYVNVLKFYLLFDLPQPMGGLPYMQILII